MAEQKEEVWVQPLGDAKPSSVINAPSDFSEENAETDAATLRKAMKGFGTDETAIINIVGKRTIAQRIMIKQAFVTVEAGKSRDLIKDLKGELSGNLEDLIVGLFLSQGEYDAERCYRACKGMGTDEEILTEIICTRTWQEIENMKNAFPTTGADDSLARTIEKETSGTYQNLLLTLLSKQRDDNGPVDEAQAKLDAEEINRHIEQSSESQAKSRLVEIFTERSWRHIASIYHMFQEISRKYNLEAAISKAFGEGSDSGLALRTIVDFSVQPYDFWSKKLLKAMKGMGTTDDVLIRVIVSRADVDLNSVGNVFSQRYGGGKTLKNWIKNELSGKYEKLALSVCGY